MEEVLQDSDNARVFTQTQLPGAPLADVPPSQTPAASQGYRPERLVRTDARALTLDAYLVTNTDEGSQQEERQTQGGFSQQEGRESNEMRKELDAQGSLHSPHNGTQRSGEQMSTRRQEQEEEEVHCSSGLKLAEGAQSTSPDATPQTAGPARNNPPASSLATLKRPRRLFLASEGPDPFACMPTPMEISNAANPARTEQTPVSGSQRVLRRRPSGGHHSSGRRSEVSSSLASIEALLGQVKASSHQGLTDLVRTFALVGVATCEHALLQHGTRLYLARLPPLLEELAYQRVLTGFGGFERIQLDPAPSVDELFRIASVQHSSKGMTTEHQGHSQDAADLSGFLLSRADMLEDHFGIDITPGEMGSPLLVESVNAAMVRAASTKSIASQPPIDLMKL